MIGEGVMGLCAVARASDAGGGRGRGVQGRSESSKAGTRLTELVYVVVSATTRAKVWVIISSE